MGHCDRWCRGDRLFLWREARTDSPLLPLQLFQSKNFSGANLLTLLLYAALGALLFFLPYNLIQVQGYTPTQAGAANLPLILILFFLSRWAGGLVAHYGAKLPLVIGPIVAACGFLLFAKPGIGGSYWTTYFPAMVVLGLGMSGVVAPLTTTVMDSVSERQAGVASGVNNAVSRVASLLSIAVLGMVAFHVFNTQLADKLDAANLPEPMKHAVLEQRNRLTQIEPPKGLDADQEQVLKRSIDESFLSGFRWVMCISAGLALLSAVSAWSMIEGKPTKIREERVNPQMFHEDWLLRNPITALTRSFGLIGDKDVTCVRQLHQLRSIDPRGNHFGVAHWNQLVRFTVDDQRWRRNLLQSAVRFPFVDSLQLRLVSLWFGKPLPANCQIFFNPLQRRGRIINIRPHGASMFFRPQTDPHQNLSNALLCAHSVGAAGRGASQNQRADARGILQRELLRNHSAHRQTKYMRAFDSGGIQRSRGIGSHHARWSMVLGAHHSGRCRDYPARWCDSVPSAWDACDAIGMKDSQAP